MEGLWHNYNAKSLATSLDWSVMYWKINCSLESYLLRMLFERASIPQTPGKYSQLKMEHTGVFSYL